MSKTDKTNPYFVKVYDRPEYLTEVHDHRGGGCTLPERPARGSEVTWTAWARGECCWAASGAFYSSDDARCGCVRCIDQAGRKAKARRVRAEGRRQARNWRQDY